MKENTLLKIALICALVGLAGLYFISTRIEARDYSSYKSGSINEDVGDDVKLKGTVAKVTDKGNVIFIEVIQQSPVNIVLFTEDDNLKLKPNDFVEVSGKVQEYNGKSEIIAQNIKKIK